MSPNTEAQLENHAKISRTLPNSFEDWKRFKLKKIPQIKEVPIVNFIINSYSAQLDMCNNMSIGVALTLQVMLDLARVRLVEFSEGGQVLTVG